MVTFAEKPRGRTKAHHVARVAIPAAMPATVVCGVPGSLVGDQYLFCDQGDP